MSYTKRGYKNKWNDEFYVLAYKLALEGMTNGEIAQAMGVERPTLTRWAMEKPGLGHALSEGRMTLEKQGWGNLTTLQDYIYGHLPLHLKKVWRKMQKIRKEKNAQKKMELLFQNNGEDARKYLFLHSLSVSHFNPTVACKKLCISRKVFTKWCTEDPVFAEHVNEIEWHKDNFIEGKVMEKAGEGNVPILMQLAKSRLAGRGYGDKSQLEITGSVQHSQVMDISQMPKKLQDMILEFYREQEDAERRSTQLLEDQT
jgi:hypothetical protein